MNKTKRGPTRGPFVVKFQAPSWDSNRLARMLEAEIEFKRTEAQLRKIVAMAKRHRLKK